MSRVVGALVLVGSLALLSFSVYALAKADEMAAGLTVVADAFGQKVDRADWQRHWVRASVINAALAAVAVAAGVGLILRRTWGILLSALVVTTALFASVAVARFGAKYTFELTEPVEWLILLAIAVISWLWYFNRRRSARSFGSGRS
jgi:hypothetical protein